VRKKKLSDLGFLTELDIIAFTVESIGNEVAAMEVNEIGKDGATEAANIATEIDLNFLEEKLRVLLSPQKFEDAVAVLNRTKESFSRIENNNSYLQQYLHESRKVIFKQTNEIRHNGQLLKMIHEHAEKLTKEKDSFQKRQELSQQKLQELEERFLLEKTTLIERVSAELHRLRFLG